MKISYMIVTGLLLTNAALADIVVVVGAKSAADKLTKEQVEKIYQSKLKEFPNGGQVIPLMINTGPIKDEFLDRIMGKSDAQMKAHWGKMVFTGLGNAPKDVADAAEVKKLVGANPNLIGYIDKSSVDPSVKVIFTP